MAEGIKVWGMVMYALPPFRDLWGRFEAPLLEAMFIGVYDL